MVTHWAKKRFCSGLLWVWKRFYRAYSSAAWAIRPLFAPSYRPWFRILLLVLLAYLKKSGHRKTSTSFSAHIYCYDNNTPIFHSFVNVEVLTSAKVRYLSEYPRFRFGKLTPSKQPIYKVNRKICGHIMFTKQLKQIKLLSDFILDIQILNLNLQPKSSLVGGTPR